MNRLFVSALAATALMGAATQASAAELLVNGGFEQTGSASIAGSWGYTYQVGDNLPGWTIDSGSVDVVIDTSAWSPPYEGNNALDIVGWVQGSISQTINTVLGATYNVSYAFSRNAAGAPDPSSALITIGSVSHAVVAQSPQNFGSPNNILWYTGGFSFTGAGGSETFRIAANDANGGCCAGGVFFDAVSVQGAIPEPATWALMIGGFGLAGATLRARRRVLSPA